MTIKIQRIFIHWEPEKQMAGTCGVDTCSGNWNFLSVWHRPNPKCMDMSFIASCLAFYTGESMKSLKMRPEGTVPRQTPSSGVFTHYYYTPTVRWDVGRLSSLIKNQCQRLVREGQKVYSTEYSQAVTHPSTNSALCCLTSVIRRELVFSTWYGRRQNECR